MKNLILFLSLLFSFNVGLSQGILKNIDTLYERYDVSSVDNFSIDEFSSEEFLVTFRANSEESKYYEIGNDGDKLSELNLEYGNRSRLHVLDDDSYIIIGSIGYPNDSSSQIVATRFDENETILWSYTYTELSTRYDNKVEGIYTLSDGLLIYGSQFDDSATSNLYLGDVRPYMFKIDWNGTKLWEVALDMDGRFRSANNYRLDYHNLTDYEYFETVSNSNLETLTFIAGKYGGQELEFEINTNGEIISQKEASQYELFKLSDFPIVHEKISEFKFTKVLIDDEEILLSYVEGSTSTYDPITEKETEESDEYICVSKFDSNKNRIWFTLLDKAYRLGSGGGHINLLENGNIIFIPGSAKLNSAIIDADNGEILNTNEIGTEEREHSIINVFEKDGFYMCAGYSFFDLKSKIIFFKIGINDLIAYDFQQTIVVDERLIQLQTVRAVSKNEYAGIGSIKKGNSITELFFFRTDSNGAILSNIISGNVYGDLGFDCQVDTSDLDLVSWDIIAKGQQNFYATSDYLGNYCIQVDTGDYQLSIIPKNDYWLNCDTIDIEFNNFYDTLTNIDLVTSAITPCSFIEVDVGFGYLRRCFSNQVVVQYCNQGTFEEEEAMIELHIDSYLDVDSTSIPILSQEDTTLFFDIGEVGIGECGKFNIWVTPNCDNTVLGQEHCINAHVYPDTLCVPQDSLWSGANVVVEAICLGDSTLFNIINMSGVATKDDLVYIVIVDDIIVSRTENYSLEGGETIQFVEYEPGSTITVIAEQEPFHPLGNQVGVEAFCAGTDFDFISEFNQYDDDPFTDIVCVENRGSYDPNDKAAIPVGDGPEHFISASQGLEYKIRFQNTGTDTAFTVVVRDTLVEELDMSTFEAGISSHDYTLSIEEENILVFTFDDILLPDSTVNWEASNGFVEFKIDQVDGNIPGIIIENTASIYFDFNDPIITNTVFHTIETPVTFSKTSIDLCANEMYNKVLYSTDTMVSVLYSTPLLDSFAITEIHVLPVDSVEQFETLAAGSSINNVLITSDTTIYENFTNVFGCDSILIRNFMIEKTNSVALLDKSHWDIFPNPTKDILSIMTNQSFSDNNYKIKLINIVGQTVYQENRDLAPNEKLDLLLGELATGTYLLSIASKHGMITEKIVVNP